jgi:hypothetical protein
VTGVQTCALPIYLNYRATGAVVVGLEVMAQGVAARSQSRRRSISDADVYACISEAFFSVDAKMIQDDPSMDLAKVASRRKSYCNEPYFRVHRPPRVA